MKKKTLSTALVGMLLGSVLMVGCSSKPVTVSEKIAPSIETPKRETTVAQNTNLGAGSSGFSR